MLNKSDLDPHYVHDNYFEKEIEKNYDEEKKDIKEHLKNNIIDDINSKSYVYKKNDNEMKLKLNLYESKLASKSQLIEDNNPLQIIEVPNNCYVCKAVPSGKSILKKCYSNKCQNHFCNNCYFKNEYQIRENKCDCKYFTCETCDNGKQCIMSTVYCTKCNKRFCNDCFLSKHAMHSS